MVGAVGHESCGCLGQVDANPWYMAIVDLALLAGLALLCLDGPDNTVSSHGWSCGLLLAAALGVPGYMTMAVDRLQPQNTYELRHDKLLHDTKLAVDVREPTAADLASWPPRPASACRSTVLLRKISMLASLIGNQSIIGLFEAGRRWRLFRDACPCRPGGSKEKRVIR